MSEKMKILITGGGGQLGRDCREVMQGRHEVLSTDLPELDITDLQAVREAVAEFQPEVILNCAAFTQVDACERETERAYLVNAVGPENLARALEPYGGWLVQISTDYVFDGGKTPPTAYVEDDLPAPLSFYGQTKLAGELAVQRITRRYMIVRTAWLYGRHGKNFLKTILRLALADPAKPLRIVNDQYGSLTWSYRLAQQLAALMESGGQGIYHATAEGYCTWYEAAGHFLKRLGVNHRIIPCTTADYPTPAVRPKNSILENRRLKAAGLNLMGHWQSDLEEFIRCYGTLLLQEARAAAG